MMAARAYWKGSIRLSLVNIPVELYSATSRANEISLHQIHKPSGKRIRYQKTAEGIGPVDTDDIVKGLEVDKGDYLILEPEELDAIKLESQSTVNLVQFVDRNEIDPRYYERPFYVVPKEGDNLAAEGFAVLRDALRSAGKTGLGQMTARGKDHVVAITPCGRGILLETLRYADEIKKSDKVFDEIPEVEPEEELLDLAGTLIEQKSGPFEPQAFKSEYQDSLRALIEEKRKSGKVLTDTAAPERSDKVVDLMKALKQSVEGEGKAKTARKKKTRKAA
jgi:DNA end-binding protein Ku